MPRKINKRRQIKLNMCSTYRIARATIDQMVASREPFTIQEVSEAIKAAGAVHRVAAGVTTKDYLEILEEQQVIVYDFSTMKYFNMSTLVENAED